MNIPTSWYQIRGDVTSGSDRLIVIGLQLWRRACFFACTIHSGLMLFPFQSKSISKNSENQTTLSIGNLALIEGPYLAYSVQLHSS